MAIATSTNTITNTSSTAIKVSHLAKQFQVQEREAGLAKAVRALFSRKYKIVDALKDMSFEIGKGEFVGIIGPNGAGKSTTIKILTGILVPTSGEANVLGLCPWKKREENARNIGVVFGQRTQLWWDLPVAESFVLLKDIYGISDTKFKKNVKIFSRVLGIDKFLQTPVRKLSLGERMRCDLAASLLHDPPVLFLDEPTIGLDVVAKEKMREFLKEINEKKKVTIVLTTHDMGDIEELCPRIIIIDKGQKLYDGPIEEIRKKFGRTRVLIIDFGLKNTISKIKWKGVKLLAKEKTIMRLAVDTKKIKVSEVIKRILSKWAVRDIAIEEPDIEEIIRRIYTKGL